MSISNQASKLLALIIAICTILAQDQTRREIFYRQRISNARIVRPQAGITCCARAIYKIFGGANETTASGFLNIRVVSTGRRIVGLVAAPIGYCHGTNCHTAENISCLLKRSK